MGFTIQDMLTTSEVQYQMKLIAGEKGWSNSISWVLMIEDTRILNNFSGKELVVTTGLGFSSTESMLELAKGLAEKSSAGLIINTGKYIKEIPEVLIDFCNENDLPLIDVPWEVYIADMIKDLSIRIFMQEAADEQISEAFIKAISEPDNRGAYKNVLLPYFDLDGSFQVILFTTEDLDSMDTVVRKKLSHRLQIYLENISHNGHFFYYDSAFVLILNDVEVANCDDIINGMIQRSKARMHDINIYIGIGSQLDDIERLGISYNRAKAALNMAVEKRADRIDFEDMGVQRLFKSVSDMLLLKEMGEEVLRPLIEYDKIHNSDYVEILRLYLKYNGSIQAVADETFTHRNTVIYRMSNIKKLLDTDFEDADERFKYLIAAHIVLNA